ncbi:helix-turn-helix transcriptional regulator [Nocardioides terrisoli]|uniref:helix-turn-helix transcriptional regulator n=1 Tax=Nocardioides terrisoli TaxID=3388267 RepID=UPI00287BBF0D|nr:helix-turn-helix domain-containing protein [Nocardioides marmorisolisilvae]
MTGRRDDVLAVLREATGPMTIVEIASALGVHPNTVRFHLDGLLERGRVDQVTSRPVEAGPGRPALRFRASSGMDPDGPRNFELLAGILAGSLAVGPDGVRRARASGRAWGRRLAATRSDGGGAGRSVTDRLVGLLADLGFAPQRRTVEGDGRSREQIALRHCPFLELVGDHRDVICPVHLGLMQGAAAEFGDADPATGPVTVDALEAFVEPDMCLAQLG